ncbi:hornerin-like [Iris pallida]|uniref:Hornerin-like n=1 Tax=Iris pallida TaxID=29817 RepID=A0AAX6G2P9_IRIPA|nr:hornerin-like [Iris pallida]
MCPSRPLSRLTLRSRPQSPPPPPRGDPRSLIRRRPLFSPSRRLRLRSPPPPSRRGLPLLLRQIQPRLDLLLWIPLPRRAPPRLQPLSRFPRPPSPFPPLLSPPPRSALTGKFLATNSGSGSPPTRRRMRSSSPWASGATPSASSVALPHPGRSPSPAPGRAAPPSAWVPVSPLPPPGRSPSSPSGSAGLPGAVPLASLLLTPRRRPSPPRWISPWTPGSSPPSQPLPRLRAALPRSGRRPSSSLRRSPRRPATRLRPAREHPEASPSGYGPPLQRILPGASVSGALDSPPPAPPPRPRCLALPPLADRPLPVLLDGSERGFPRPLGARPIPSGPAPGHVTSGPAWSSHVPPLG